ncbi:MAG: hypothetical protein LQ347_006355 [Umbilicaria vellea]|nr:MAG: hypothetical protein LQ347_006355 [Umbilicaria vellea]
MSADWPSKIDNTIDNTMAFRASTVSTFEVERTIQPIYTGGDVALDQDGRILATCLGEDALLTDLGTGEQLARIEGVGRRSPYNTLK